MTSSRMRYILVPSAEKVVDMAKPEAGPKSFSYFDLMDQYVWPRSEWRKDETHASVYNRVWDAHKRALDTGVVALLETDYAIFAPFATLQNEMITGPNVHAVNRLTQAVTFATSDSPEKGECSP